MPAKRKTSHDYGYAHRKLRETLLPRAYGTPCVRCGQPLEKGQPIDLDHNDDRRTYLGFSHSVCNRRAGAEKTNQPKSPKPRSATRW